MSIIARLKQLSSKEDLIKSDVPSELTFEEACILIDEKIGPQYSVFLQTKYIDMGFYFLSKDKIEVEIDDERNGFWAIAEITPKIAKKIIEIAINDELFGKNIPLTNKEWGAYGDNN